MISRQFNVWQNHTSDSYKTIKNDISYLMHFYRHEELDS